MELIDSDKLVVIYLQRFPLIEALYPILFGIIDQVIQLHLFYSWRYSQDVTKKNINNTSNLTTKLHTMYLKNCTLILSNFFFIFLYLYIFL